MRWYCTSCDAQGGYMHREFGGRLVCDEIIMTADGGGSKCGGMVVMGDHHPVPPDCDICGEPIGPTDEMAEMYDEDRPWLGSFICHAQCGIDRGLEIA